MTGAELGRPGGRLGKPGSLPRVPGKYGSMVFQHGACLKGFLVAVAVLSLPTAILSGGPWAPRPRHCRAGLAASDDVASLNDQMEISTVRRLVFPMMLALGAVAS